VVRRLAGPVTAGFHRVAWDLKYPSLQPWKPGAKDSSGVLAAPGRYTVSLARRVDGAWTNLEQEQEFEVKRMREGTLEGAGPDAVVAFLKQVAEMQRVLQGATSAIDETARKLQGMREALMRSTVDDLGLEDRTRALERRLGEIRERIHGNGLRRRMADPGPVSIARRLSVAVNGTNRQTYGPTPTHRKSFEIARQQFADLRKELDRLIGTEVLMLEAELEAAGLPWTPGRAVPEPRVAPMP